MGEAAMAEPIEVLRKFYWLLARGDAPGALALLHSEVEWTEAKRSPYYAGTLRGAQSVVSKVFEPITGDFEDFATAPSEFLAQGESDLDRQLFRGRQSDQAALISTLRA